jgi:hypothetical protein
MLITRGCGRKLHLVQRTFPFPWLRKPVGDAPDNAGGDNVRAPFKSLENFRYSNGMLTESHLRLRDISVPVFKLVKGIAKEIFAG